MADPPASNKASFLAQYLTGLAATMGALSTGVILGYSSPASVQLAGANDTSCTADDDFAGCSGNSSECQLINDEGLSAGQLSLFSSSVNLAAVVGSPLAGVLINRIGRRSTMILSIVPFVLGWTLIGTAVNFAMLMCGRLICGIAAGLICLVVPTYIGEIASPEVRGLLGTYFQLMVSGGFLYAYVIGSFLCWRWLALASLAPVAVFVTGMVFAQESPSFLLMKNKDKEAREALTHLRGKRYNVDPELDQLKQSITEAKANKGSFRDLLLPYNLKPLVISMSLLIFQQSSGVNAILFNLATIFKSANSSLSSNASSIIIAAVQVVATAVASVLMDKAGRKVLLLVSSAAMTLSLVAMGVFFYLQETDPAATVSLGWLPLVSLISYITFFSLGYGPVPWVMMGELFTADVRDLAVSLVTMVNWTAAFIVTLVFVPLQGLINDSGVYWLFAGICAVNFVFCLVLVQETKGKTIQEISAMFGAPSGSTKLASSTAAAACYTNTQFTSQ